MLQLHRLGGPVVVINPDLIERAEATPDTVVTLVDGNKYVIQESLDDLVEAIRNWRSEVIAMALSMGGDTAALAAQAPAPTWAQSAAHQRHPSTSSTPEGNAAVIALHPHNKGN